jgi:hypothetical protein
MRASRRGSANDEAVREYTAEYVVVVTALTDGPLTVRFMPGVPRIYDSYVGFATGEYDITSFCRNVEIAESSEGPYVWLVTAKFSSKLDRPQDQQNDNPLLRAAEIEWSSAPFERPLTKDNNGDDITNSANEAFDPPPTIEENRPVLVITRNEGLYDPARTLLYEDAVNTDIFYGAGPRFAKIKSITGKRQFENGFIFWSVKYEIHFRRDGFDYRFLDQGFRDASGKLFRDPVDGSPYSSPTLLDGSGGNLKYAGPFQLATAVDFVQEEIQVNSLGTALPDPTNYEYSILVDEEEMLVTGNEENVTNFLTVVRGTNATTASPHAKDSAAKLLTVWRRFRARKELPFSALGLS